MYSIKEFSAMVGLPESSIRYYEKEGLKISQRRENGYRVFTPEDAFRVNSFRMLLQYGFSVKEAVEMLDARQNAEDFEQALVDQRQRLEREADLIGYRLSKIDTALGFIQYSPDENFDIVDVPDQIYVQASQGRDFSVSVPNKEAITRFYDLLTVASCARIITREDILGQGDTIDPTYILAMPLTERYRLDDIDTSCVQILMLGKCLRFRRRLTRAESVVKETFCPMLDYLDGHGYSIRSDLILFPTLMNLDGAGQDVETLYVPIK